MDEALEQLDEILSCRLDVGRRTVKPCTVVIFGASGDLTARKLIPALFQLCAGKQLPDPCRIVGFARRPKTTEAWRAELRQALQQFSRPGEFDPAKCDTFSAKVSYCAGEFGDPAAYQRLRAQLDGFGHEMLRRNLIFYLATSPSQFAEIAEHLHEAGLTKAPKCAESGCSTSDPEYAPRRACRSSAAAPPALESAPDGLPTARPPTPPATAQTTACTPSPRSPLAPAPPGSRRISAPRISHAPTAGSRSPPSSDPRTKLLGKCVCKSHPIIIIGGCSLGRHLGQVISLDDPRSRRHYGITMAEVCATVRVGTINVEGPHYAFLICCAAASQTTAVRLK